MDRKYERDSITVDDYNKYQQCLSLDRSVVPHVQLRYKTGYWNVFIYNAALELWLKENEIPYRINWEDVTYKYAQKPYKDD